MNEREQVALSFAAGAVVGIGATFFAQSFFRQHHELSDTEALIISSPAANHR
jgi:hypothetical protein